MHRKTAKTRAIGAAILCLLLSGGCAGREPADEPSAVQESTEETPKADKGNQTEVFEQNQTAVEEKSTETASNEIMSEPEFVEADFSEYFEGLNGAAVIYDVSDRRYTVYNRSLAETRRSPCSTFKMISSLIALEHGIIDPDASVRVWSKEIFWNEKWNQDIDFYNAFRESCVWYFRQVTDEIGPEKIKEELEKLSYGNCDISDWEGRLNTNNQNRALTGFWIESSLKISPKEQAEVMERIFGSDSPYAKETITALKEVMKVGEQNQSELMIYGKTGMGKANGVLVDAWFAGFAETAEKQITFCIYLGKSDEKNASSATAKNIAVRLVEEYFNES